MIKSDFRFYINDKNTKEAKFIKVLTGKKRREIQEIVKTAPVDEYQRLLLDVVIETDGDEYQALDLIKDGKIKPDDLLRFQKGNYIPNNSEDYYKFVYDFFRLLLDEVQKPDVSKAIKEDYYGLMDNQDFLEVEAVISSFRKNAGI